MIFREVLAKYDSGRDEAVEVVEEYSVRCQW